MTLKFLIGVSAVVLFTFLGVGYSKKYSRKKDFFISLENFGVYLKREISFSSTPIGEVISNFNCDNEDLNDALGKALNKGARADEASLPDFLSADERDFINSYFSKLGRSDRENEIELTERFIEEAGKYKKSEAEKYNKISSVSARLGFFAGMIFFVLIL